MCPGLNKITYNCSCSTKLSQALTTTTDSGQVNLEQQNMCTFISLWWRWNPFLSKVSFRQLIYSLHASMHLRPRAENTINFCRLPVGYLSVKARCPRVQPLCLFSLPTPLFQVSLGRPKGVHRRHAPLGRAEDGIWWIWPIHLHLLLLTETYFR